MSCRRREERGRPPPRMRRVGADALVLMVVNAAQAEAVLFDDGGLDALPPDGIVVLMATCPPASVEGIAVSCRSRRPPLRRCSGFGRCGGSGRRHAHHHGGGSQGDVRSGQARSRGHGRQGLPCRREPGQGAMVKTVNQLLCGVHIAVAAEAFSLAAKVGVDMRGPAGNRLRLGGVELDAEGPGPADAGRGTGGHQRG